MFEHEALVANIHCVSQTLPVGHIEWVKEQRVHVGISPDLNFKTWSQTGNSQDNNSLVQHVCVLWWSVTSEEKLCSDWILFAILWSSYYTHLVATCRRVCVTKGGGHQLSSDHCLWPLPQVITVTLINMLTPFITTICPYLWLTILTML